MKYAYLIQSSLKNVINWLGIQFFHISLIEWVFWFVMSMVAIKILRILNKRRWINDQQTNSFCFLVPYLMIVLFSTVFSRIGVFKREVELSLFWSYREFFLGDNSLGIEIIANIICMMPVGYALSFVFRKKKTLKVIATGFLFSLIIEVLQLILKCGMFEIDDLFNNVLGVGLGYLICRKIRKG